MKNMKVIKPLSPSELKDIPNKSIDPAIIQAVNNLLIKNYSEGSAIIKQDEIIEEYFKITGTKNKESKRAWLFENKQLSFERIYEKEGWKVEYDKPGYNETYDATFEFTPKKGR